MNIWIHAALCAAVVGLIVAFVRAATLGPVVQQFSERKLSDDARVADVVDAMATSAEGRRGFETFVRNLSLPAFWRIVLGLWFSISIIGFAACALLIWTI